MRWLNFFIIFSFLFFVHTHGFPTQDEGWFLQAGARVARGEFVYKDYQFLYHPGFVYLNAIAFRLFGFTVLSSRMFAFFNSVIAVMAIWYLAKRWSWSKILTSSVLLFWLAWGPLHLNFVWPVMLCLTVGLLMAVCFELLTSRKEKSLLWFLNGVLTGWMILLKQNFGIAIVGSTFIWLIFSGEWKLWRRVVVYGIGIASVLFLQLWYWVHTGTLLHYISDMKYLLWERIIQQGVLNSEYPWQYPGPLHYQIAKFFFYLLPFIINTSAFFLVWKRKEKKQYFLPIFANLFYLLSIRPTTDVVHLVPLLAISGLNVGVIHQQIKAEFLKKIIVACLAVGGCFGMYHGFMKNYYRWDMPLIEQTYFESTLSMKIWTNPGVAQTVRQLQLYVEKEAPHQSELFVYNYAPYLYLALDKRNPTRYDYLHTGVMNEEIEREIMAILDSKKLALVIANFPLKNDPSTLSQYIQAHYEQKETFGDFTVWKRFEKISDI